MKKYFKIAFLGVASLFCITSLCACSKTKEGVLERKKIEEHTEFLLWPENKTPFEQEGVTQKATIQTYLVKDSDKSIVIYPGGGYFQLSVESEGEQVAKAYNELGYNAFVVNYRYKPYDGKAMLADAQRAIQWVRYYADELDISPDKIATCGFSAGGHLSVMVAQHDSDEILVDDEIGKLSSKPDACILAYPVVTLGDGTYPTMPEIFLGENASNPEEIEKYSYTYNIEAMPATFVFTSQCDTAVDYKKNAASIADALDTQNIPVEYKEYADGGHGVGVGKQYKEYSAWLKDSIVFLERWFALEYKNIYCIGDSLTEGDYGVYQQKGIKNVQRENYPYYLSRLTGAKVTNYGRCGHRAIHCLELCKQKVIDVQDADLILIMLGTNGGFSTTEDTQDNGAYRSIINYCKSKAPNAKIYLIAPPYATENPMYSNYGYAENVTNAGEFVKGVAKEMDLKVIDLKECEELGVEQDDIMRPNDGLHCTQVGYYTIAKYIYDNL